MRRWQVAKYIGFRETKLALGSDTLDDITDYLDIYDAKCMNKEVTYEQVRQGNFQIHWKPVDFI